MQLNSKSQKNFMTIVFNEAEKISKEAQASLRRTMEKYVMKCRLILVCENLGNLIPALLSRCLLLRCRGPTEEEASACLKKISQAENYKISDEAIVKILNSSKHVGINLRRSIFGLQNEYILKISKNNDKYIDWNKEVISVVEAIRKNQV